MICSTCRGRGYLYEFYVRTGIADWRKTCADCGGHGAIRVPAGEPCPCECGKAPLLGHSEGAGS